MVNKEVLKRGRDLKERKIYAADSTVRSESEKPSSKDSGKIKPKSKKPNVPSPSVPLDETVSENTLLLKNAEIIVIGFLGSLINYSRTTEFSLEQLYLETILLSVIYYLVFQDIIGTVAVLLGGYLQWYLSLATKSKYLTVLIMTCLQVLPIDSLRYFEWVEMMLHIFYSCIPVYFMHVSKLLSVWLLRWGLIIAYCEFLRKFGTIYIEDVFLTIIIICSGSYNTTGDIEHCFLYENLSTAIIWMLHKHIRTYTGSSDYSFKLF